ncbi:MAG: HemK2/MTQ2 family protein methyltransferase [Sporichthyaceae bacterium]
MLILRMPGVYAPQTDTELLLTAALAHPMPERAAVLDICTGSGRIAVGLAHQRDVAVTAVDISRRAVMSTRLNAWLHKAPVGVRRGHLLDAVAGRRFDLIVANPPYVPSVTARVRHSSAVAWDAGIDGREILDQICERAPKHLSARGVLLLVHSELCNARQTVQQLQRRGLDAAVIDRAFIPFGPVMRSRAGWLRAQGLIEADQDIEELVVVRGRALAPAALPTGRVIEPVESLAA